MSDTLIAAIVGAVAGIITGSIGSLFAPWANWGVEKRRKKHEYRKDLIKEWREMLAHTTFAYTHRVEEDNSTWIEILERDSRFYSLKPHLHPELLERLGTSRQTEVGKVLADVNETEAALVKSGFKPYITTGARRVLVDEIARLEKEWGLI
jgi:hypothetical protein